MAPILDLEEEEKQSHSHLTEERRPRRNKLAAILKRDDLDEERSHEYFIEHLRSYHKLNLVDLDWSFISKYPQLKAGGTICKEFVDGILLPESICVGKSSKELKDYMQEEFIDCGLFLRKVVPKKAQSFYKKDQVLHTPYFAKLDDRGYDLTVKRLTELKTVTERMGTEILKLDITVDCEGCLFVPGSSQLSETLLAKNMTALGFKVRKDTHKWSTFVSFERDDLYANIYNKPV
jgi:hypothetical protein